MGQFGLIMKIKIEDDEDEITRQAREKIE